mgnify:CR=1 FL=1
MIYYLHLLSEHFGPLNYFQYTTTRALLAFVISFGLSLIFGKSVIRKLISLKIGQPIRSEDEVHKLAELHEEKAGTPTMGGVLLLGTTLIATLVCARPDNPFVVATAFAMGTLGLLGFVDDYTKVKEKNSEGVSGKTKLAVQGLVGLTVGCFLYFYPNNPGFTVQVSDYISPLSTPFGKAPLFDMGWLCIPFFMFIIVGCSNAVNLTDGLDGLATGCTISTAFAYAVIAYLAGHQWLATEYLFIPHQPMVMELSILLFALLGAGFGFLWFNCHPAKMFMGDTGSLAIGGALATAAICCKQEFLLVVIGGVFVMEAMSVILQVGSFKLRGKRIFAMSPIHHHFELKGWHENQVIIRFWLLSLFLALIGLGTLKIL